MKVETVHLTKCDIYCLHIFSFLESMLAMLFMNEEKKKPIKTVASFDTSFGSEWRREGERMAYIHLCFRNNEPQT